MRSASGVSHRTTTLHSRTKENSRSKKSDSYGQKVQRKKTVYEYDESGSSVDWESWTLQPKLSDRRVFNHWGQRVDPHRSPGLPETRLFGIPFPGDWSPTIVSDEEDEHGIVRRAEPDPANRLKRLKRGEQVLGIAVSSVSENGGNKGDTAATTSAQSSGSGVEAGGFTNIKHQDQGRIHKHKATAARGSRRASVSDEDSVASQSGEGSSSSDDSNNEVDTSDSEVLEAVRRRREVHKWPGGRRAEVAGKTGGSAPKGCAQVAGKTGGSEQAVGGGQRNAVWSSRGARGIEGASGHQDHARGAVPPRSGGTRAGPPHEGGG